MVRCIIVFLVGIEFDKLQSERSSTGPVAFRALNFLFAHNETPYLCRFVRVDKLELAAYYFMCYVYDSGTNKII